MKDTQTLRTQYKVSDFVAWQRDGALELNPNFQRRPVWSPKAKSFLIDTIMRGMPVPIIFLRDKQSDLRTLKPMRDVVDGQQRIRTVLSYIDNSLVKDFDVNRDQFTIDKAHAPDLAGKKFTALPVADQRRILDYQFSVHIFEADTDDKEILQIFARMNSTGVKVNNQELRNAEFFGQFKTAAYELSTEQLDRWRGWNIFTPNQIARMDEVELTSEFMLLIMNGVLSKRIPTIDSYYRYYDEAFPERAEVTRRIHATFDQIESLLPRDVIAKSFSSRTFFYAVFAIVYGMQFGIRSPVALAERAPLKREKAKPLKAGLAEQLKQAVLSIRDETAPLEVLKVARGAVTDAGARRIIIEHLAGKGNSPCPPLP